MVEGLGMAVISGQQLEWVSRWLQAVSLVQQGYRLASGQVQEAGLGCP